MAETTRVRAADYFEPVMRAVGAAGEEGITLRELGEKLDVRTRVLHNVTYRLEKDEKIRRVGEGRRVRYAAAATKPAKPARKPRAPKTTTAA